MVTNQNLIDAANDAMLDALETGEEYEVDGEFRVKRDLSSIHALRRHLEARQQSTRPAFNHIRLRRRS